MTFAAFLGVFVDLDHFVIARVRTGSWRHFRWCLANPIPAFTDQGTIFEEGDVGAVTRLVSHVAVTAVLVAGLGPVAPRLAALAGVVLAVHVASDVAWEVHRFATDRPLFG